MAKTKYILSIDGGGMRGIIPAMILAQIEKITKKRITDIFDMLAGSSSGGLIVAGLNHNKYPRYSANYMVHLFTYHGRHIFADRMMYPSGNEYSDDYLNRVLDDYLEDKNFSQTTRNMLVTSYDIYNNKPFVMSSWSEETRHIMVKDAVRATLAVPTLFSPKEIKAPKLDGTVYNNRVLVCGSMFANNPAGYAYAAACKLWPDHEYILLSLGTGRTDMYITLNEAKDLKEEDWIRTLRQISFSTCHGMNYLLSSIMQSNFIRIQGFASSPASEIDNASKRNIETLEREGMITIRKNKKLINKFCSLVS